MVLSETTAAGTTRYVYGPDNVALERIDPAANATYYHADQLGSVRQLTDSTGAVVGAATYDPYGKVAAATGAFFTQPFGFAGEYTDAETGFQYLRARYYDPATGQFLSRDPIEAVTRSAYGYVYGNPLNSTDPSGLGPLDWAKRNLSFSGLANAGGEVTTWTGRASAVVDAASYLPLPAGPAGVPYAAGLKGAAEGLNQISMAASALELGCGLVTHDEEHIRNGGIGLALGLFVFVVPPPYDTFINGFKLGVSEYVNGLPSP